MNPFHGRHFQGEIILWAVRWYCKYGISYRELQEMLAERGVNVDHWKSFIQMREEINNPLTPSGAKALLKKLEEYGIDANQSLINAIIGNYSNVLEPNYERVSCGPSRTHHNLLER
jgi:hypothetical protein